MNDKLTLKQRDEIIELYKNLHITGGGVFCTKEDAFMLFKNAFTANTEPEDEPKTLSELFEYEDATLTEDAQLNVGKEEWLDIMSSGPTYVSPISNKTCDHTELTEGCPACHEWATGTPAHTAEDEGNKTCSSCYHVNDGDGFCELENVAYEYKARCKHWLQQEDK